MIALPRECVVDASIGIKLFLPEEDAEKAQAFVTALSAGKESLHVPDLFFVEFANVLWKAVTRLRYPLESARANLVSMREMELSATPTEELSERALEIACQYSLTAYDACYVALAERLNVPLFTADSRLAGRLAGTPHQVLTLAMI